MTRDEIAGKIRRNLNDAGITYYSAEDINDSIQDGYDEIAVYSECIEKRVELSFLANRTYINIRNLVPDYFRPIYIYSDSNGRYLDLVDDRDLLSYRQNWEMIMGSISEYMILDSNQLGFSGRLNSVTSRDTFKLFYKATANILTSTAVPQINTNYQQLLIDYGTADLLEQNQEFQKATRKWMSYETMLEDYRTKIQLLAKSDRVFTR